MAPLLNRSRSACTRHGGPAPPGSARPAEGRGVGSCLSGRPSIGLDHRYLPGGRWRPDHSHPSMNGPFRPDLTAKFQQIRWQIDSSCRFLSVLMFAIELKIGDAGLTRWEALP